MLGTTADTPPVGAVALCCAITAHAAQHTNMTRLTLLRSLLSMGLSASRRMNFTGPCVAFEATERSNKSFGIILLTSNHVNVNVAHNLAASGPVPGVPRSKSSWSNQRSGGEIANKQCCCAFVFSKPG